MNYPLQMEYGQKAAGYLLAGGLSSRMGRDKALLPVGGGPILVHSMNLLRSCCENATLIAPAGKYDAFGFRTISDGRSGLGPLAGIEAALIDTRSEWNLILACDMPAVTNEWLWELLTTARNEADGALCVASANDEDNPNPLCAVWHRDALSRVQKSLNSGHLRVRDLLPVVQTRLLIPANPKMLANWNRPEDLPQGNINIEC